MVEAAAVIAPDGLGAVDVDGADVVAAEVAGMVAGAGAGVGTEGFDTDPGAAADVGTGGFDADAVVAGEVAASATGRTPWFCHSMICDSNSLTFDCRRTAWASLTFNFIPSSILPRSTAAAISFSRFALDSSSCAAMAASMAVFVASAEAGVASAFAVTVAASTAFFRANSC